MLLLLLDGQYLRLLAQVRAWTNIVKYSAFAQQGSLVSSESITIVAAASRVLVRLRTPIVHCRVVLVATCAEMDAFGLGDDRMVAARREEGLFVAKDRLENVPIVLAETALSTSPALLRLIAGAELERVACEVSMVVKGQALIG